MTNEGEEGKRADEMEHDCCYDHEKGIYRCCIRAKCAAEHEKCQKCCPKLVVDIFCPCCADNFSNTCCTETDEYDGDPPCEACTYLPCWDETDDGIPPVISKFAPMLILHC